MLLWRLRTELSPTVAPLYLRAVVLMPCSSCWSLMKLGDAGGMQSRRQHGGGGCTAGGDSAAGGEDLCHSEPVACSKPSHAKQHTSRSQAVHWGGHAPTAPSYHPQQLR